MVGGVRAEAPLDGTGRDPERGVAGRRLDGAQVETVERPRTDQRVELGRDLRPEGSREPPLSTPSAESAR